MRDWRIRLIAALLFFPCFASSFGEEVLFREEFEDLQNWEGYYFDKIPGHTLYSIEKEGELSILAVRAKASASGIIFNEVFDVYKYPILEWRWMAMNVLEKGDARNKKADDYPLRIYVVFRYDPDRAPAGMRLKYNLAKRLKGEFPPHAGLNYIWANRAHDQRFIPNTYTSSSMMIVMDEGERNTGTWRTHRVSILEDYREAFGEDPPAEAALVVMGDSDNTGEETLGYIDYLEIKR